MPSSAISPISRVRVWSRVEEEARQLAWEAGKFASWAWEEAVEGPWLRLRSPPWDGASLSSWVPGRPGPKPSAWHRDCRKRERAPQWDFLRVRAEVWA